MALMNRLVVEHDFKQPPAEVFAYLSEHEKLGDILGAKVKRISNGSDGSRNGVGSVRSLKPGGILPAFQETVTEVVPNELIRYRITKGSPLREHKGEMVFTPRDGGTHLEWIITFRGAAPGLGKVVETMLGRPVPRGLDRAHSKS